MYTVDALSATNVVTTVHLATQNDRKNTWVSSNECQTFVVDGASV